jgi:excisionase family DNA binding protein
VSDSISDPKPWLTPPEIAERLRVDASKVIGWIRAGRLVAINVSEGARPRYRIDPAEFDRFIAGRSTSPPPSTTRRKRRQDASAYY